MNSSFLVGHWAKRRKREEEIMLNILLIDNSFQGKELKVTESLVQQIINKTCLVLCALAS